MVQRVKYLYLDDKGRLIADLEGGQSVVIGIREAFPGKPFYGFNSEEGNPESEVDEIPVLPGYHPPEEFGSPMPAPSAELEGMTASHRHDGKTTVYLCVQNSQGEYEWIQTGQST